MSNVEPDSVLCALWAWAFIVGYTMELGNYFLGR